MTKKRKKNPVLVLWKCLRIWSELHQFRGVFSLRDASLNWREVILPSRFSYRAAGLKLDREATVEKVEGEAGVHRVILPGREVSFYWLGRVDPNLYSSIAQEFDNEYPHYYTTPPVQMTEQSLVLDVGACEGLFAYRMIKQKQAGRVICFEPSARVAGFTRRGGEENGVADKLTVESMAVGRQSGKVKFIEGDTPEGSRIAVMDSSEAGEVIDVVSLDDYCADHDLHPGRRDLLKIDAEGVDFEILQGAERIIREGKPQIAVTTYHNKQHARQMIEWLRRAEPSYRLRLKGFCYWGGSPRPVLLQAAT